MQVMTMMRLDQLFEVTYGNKFDYNKMTVASQKECGINFVGRSSRNHGVSGVVKKFKNIEPYDKGLITVSLGGSKLLSAFIQDAPFYTAQNVAVLRPLSEMSFQQKLYICLCIRHNRFRYSAFGREANRTLKSIAIPALSDFPDWLSQEPDLEIERLRSSENNAFIELDVSKWKYFSLGDLFSISKGKRLTKANMTEGLTPYIGASDSHNGVTARIGQEAIHKGGTISVSYNGSVAEAFYQPNPFWATDDVNVLNPNFDMSAEIAIFLCTIIRLEKYRYNFGRKWHLERMRESLIKLPAVSDSQPDYEFMERYMKSLSYSSQLSS